MCKVVSLTLVHQEINNLQKRFQVIILLLVAVCGLLLLGRTQTVNAASGCSDYSCGPNCASPKIDLTCQRNRLIDPKTVCTLLYCADTVPCVSAQKDKVNVNFFGVDFHFDSDKEITSLVYIGFSLFLGVVAVAITGLGVYGAYLRSKAESPDDAAKAAKVLTNALIGLVLIVLAAVIAHLVANALGVQSLDQLISTSVFTQC